MAQRCGGVRGWRKPTGARILSAASKPLKVVAAGAGIAGLELALALRSLSEGLVSVELVAPEKEFVYRPLAVAEPFLADEVRRFTLEPLFSATGAALRGQTVVRADAEAKPRAFDV